MDPDLDLQLKVAMKALGDTIGPAIDPANKPALEQFGLVLATLGMVREHLPVQRRFVRRQLEDAIRLAEALDAATDKGGLADVIAAGHAVLADPEAEADEIESHRGALNGRASAVIAALDPAGLEGVRAIVLDHARPGLERTRAWFAGSGFEAGATDIRPLAALL